MTYLEGKKRMASLKFIKPGDNVTKIGTKQAVRRYLITKILLILWLLQTLCTVGYIFFSLNH